MQLKTQLEQNEALVEKEQALRQKLVQELEEVGAGGERGARVCPCRGPWGCEKAPLESGQKTLGQCSQLPDGGSVTHRLQGAGGARWHRLVSC